MKEVTANTQPVNREEAQNLLDSHAGNHLVVLCLSDYQRRRKMSM